MNNTLVTKQIATLQKCRKDFISACNKSFDEVLKLIEEQKMEEQNMQWNNIEIMTVINCVDENGTEIIITSPARVSLIK